jgi:1-deoxy-D-xylulose-5-phosphate synthase
VTLILDRAGITGPDGASHHGMWDLSILGLIPGIRVAAPRDADTLRTELREAVGVEDGPTVLRFPRGGVIASVPAVDRVGSVDVLRAPGADEGRDVLLVAVGAFGELGVRAAERLAERGIGVTVVDPRWVVPVPSELVTLAGDHRLVATVEDSGRHGGVGWALAAALRDADVPVPLVDLAVPQRFVAPGTRDEVLAEIGLTAEDVADAVVKRLGQGEPVLRLADRRAELA